MSAGLGALLIDDNEIDNTDGDLFLNGNTGNLTRIDGDLTVSGTITNLTITKYPAVSTQTTLQSSTNSICMLSDVRMGGNYNEDSDYARSFVGELAGDWYISFANS